MLPRYGLFLGVPEYSVFTQPVFLLDGGSKAYMQMMGWRDQSSSAHSDPFIVIMLSLAKNCRREGRMENGILTEMERSR